MSLFRFVLLIMIMIQLLLSISSIIPPARKLALQKSNSVPVLSSNNNRQNLYTIDNSTDKRMSYEYQRQAAEFQHEIDIKDELENSVVEETPKIALQPNNIHTKYICAGLLLCSFMIFMVILMMIFYNT